jgi:hypothetical protein
MIFHIIWYSSVPYSKGTQYGYKWILISLNISFLNCIYNIFCHISVIFTSAKISYFAVINSTQKKSIDFEEDVNRLQVMQHANYPTAEHVTTPVTYKYPQSVRCSTDTQNTEHELHTATVFDFRHCGSYRVILAGFSVL